MTSLLTTRASRAPKYLALALLCASLCLCASAQKISGETQLKSPLGTTITGTLDGTPYRIDVPNDWNHMLVLYYHGYAQQPATFHIAEKLNARQMPLLERHYAVAQSAYSLPGWALPQAYPETESLRKYFGKKIGMPKETYVAGESMGGALVMVTLELNPKPYMGGLDLCGAVGPTFESFERRFAMRAAFDHYFPNLLGPLVPVPTDFEATQAMRDKVAVALTKNPAAATELRTMLGVHTDVSLGSDIVYFTFVVGDMQRRAGGNPFDNRNYLYTGTNPASSAGDFELNDNVRRYAAVPKAREYLMSHYYPSGRLQKPMLALHTLYDPVVPAGSLALYDHMVQAAGFGDNLVQKYVKSEGHCNITAEQVGHAFDELVDWTHRGVRPTPGALRDLQTHLASQSPK